VTGFELQGRQRWSPDVSHPAMAVNLDACIQCGLCVRACREGPGERRDRHGLPRRHAKIIFDCDDPMGEKARASPAGECVQACPTGALMPASLVQNGVRVHTPSAAWTVCAPTAASAAR